MIIKRGTTGLIMLQKVDPEKLEIARHFRKHMTDAEKRFWQHARGNKIKGLQYRRQQVIHGFIADFYCNQSKLVVEIDGGIHETQKDYDKLRDQIISSYGLKVLRFTNDDVLNRIDWVIAQVAEHCAT